MKKAAKVAVSLPAQTFAALERVRRRLKKTRSAVVARALEEWLRTQDLSEKDRRYVEGYRRHPERPEDLEALDAILKVSTWEPWE